MNEPELRQLRRGESESRALTASGLDCYAATSRRFDVGLAPATRRLPVADRDRLARGHPRPAWPDDAPFAACLTHDVDDVSAADSRALARRARRRVRAFLGAPFDRRAARALRGTIWSLARSLRTGRGEDPLHCYERWLSLEAEFGARSTFFFLPDTYSRAHYSDGGYRYADTIRFDEQWCTVAEMMREIRRRGWEIGLHGSWHAFDSSDMMRRQKEQVERASDGPVWSVRQHNLHFDIRKTPRVCRAAGLLFDSSLGFNDAIGFRMGTCWPWELLDPESDPDGVTLEIPLVIQDKCLLDPHEPGGVERALERAVHVASQVEEVGGVLTLLWHPNLIADDESVRLYRWILQHLRTRGAWFGTTAEVGRWWCGGSRPRCGS